MFYATLLACSLFTADCIELQDERGPYKTFDECKGRIEEMANLAIYMNLRPVAFKCEKKGRPA